MPQLARRCEKPRALPNTAKWAVLAIDQPRLSVASEHAERAEKAPHGAGCIAASPQAAASGSATTTSAPHPRSTRITALVSTS